MLSCIIFTCDRKLYTNLLQSFSMYYIAKSIVSSIPLANDPESAQHEAARKKAAANLRRLDRRGDDDSSSDEDTDRTTRKSRRTKKEDLVLDQYESQIALEVVAPEDISVGFDGMLHACANNSSLIASRHRRPGRHHRRIERVRHLSAHYATFIFAIVCPPSCSIRSPTLRSTRMR